VQVVVSIQQIALRKVFKIESVWFVKMVDMKFSLGKRDFVWIGFLIVFVGVGFVYGYNSGVNDPSIMGHSGEELEVNGTDIQTYINEGDNYVLNEMYEEIDELRDDLNDLEDVVVDIDVESPPVVSAADCTARTNFKYMDIDCSTERTDRRCDCLVNLPAKASGGYAKYINIGGEFGVGITGYAYVRCSDGVWDIHSTDYHCQYLSDAW